MKGILLVVLGLAVLVSCSAPQKYTYHFDHHKYQSVKKNAIEEKASRELVAVEVRAQQEDLKVNTGELMATASETTGVEVKNPVLEKAGQLAAKYNKVGQLNSKSEKKELRQEMKEDLKSLKKDLKQFVKEKKASPDSTISFKDLDKYLKLAIVFAIAAVVASLIPGLWYVGSILGLVALIFLILWLVEQ